MENVELLIWPQVGNQLNVNTFLPSQHVVRTMVTVVGIVMMFHRHLLLLLSPLPPPDHFSSTTIPSGLRQCQAPVDSETTEDADLSFRWMTGLRQVAIQTLSISAVRLMAIAEEPGNIAPVTRVSITDQLASQEAQALQCL